MILNRDFIAVTCINSKTDDVRDHIERILNESEIIELSQDEFELPTQPYNSSSMAVTIWEPSIRINSTMLMANFSDGWLTLVHNLGLKYGHELFRLRVSDPKYRWPVCSMTYYKAGKEQGTIQALKDDPRWEFFEEGEVLEFESPEFYQKRRIKDRFNKEILLRYLISAGWMLQNKKMWQPKNSGYLIKYK